MLIPAGLLLLTPLVQADPAAQGAAPDLYLPARRWALVIGASEYEHMGRLSYAGEDASAFAEVLVERFGFDAEDVRLYRDGEGALAGQAPTAGHVLGELEVMLADPRRRETDLFVFFFAGHGVGTDSGDYLLPTDARPESATRVGLAIKEVIDRFSRAGMSNVFIVVDGCRSGAGNPFGAELWQLAEEARLAVLLSCEPGAQSYEYAPLGHGVFTHQLIAALESDELFDVETGILWASRIAQRVRAGVEAFTQRGFDGAQVPQIWTDSTRDIVLAARPLKDSDGVDASRALTRLQGNSYLASALAYADALYFAGRSSACIELLEGCEQIEALPHSARYLLGIVYLEQGRYVEAGRCFSRVRKESPNDVIRWFATVMDLSAATHPRDRYRAARALRTAGVTVGEELAFFVLLAWLQGGPWDELRPLLSDVVERAPETSGVAIYARGLQSLLDGDHDGFLLALERVDRFPNGHPLADMLRSARVDLLIQLERADEALAVLDAWVGEAPENGVPRALRAWAHWRSGTNNAAFDDARAALELPCNGWFTWLAVQSAGLRASELLELVRARAAEHPNAWHAQLALAFVEEGLAGELLARLPAVERLAPGGASVLVSALQAYLNLAELAVRERLASAEQLDKLRVRFFDVLSEQAQEFPGTGEGWKLVESLAIRLALHLPLYELFEAVVGDRVDSGTHELTIEALIPYAYAALNAGRLERFRQLVGEVERGSGAWVDLRWLEASLHASRGELGAARAVLDGLPQPTAPMASIEVPLRALIAALEGDVDAARAQLAASAALEGDLALALRTRVRQVLGDRAEAAADLERLRAFPGTSAFFLSAACLRADAEVTGASGDLAYFATLWAPGNGHYREVSFASEHTTEAFAGNIDLQVVAAAGGQDGHGAEAFFAVRSDGRVRGSIEFSEDSELSEGREHSEDWVWTLSGQIDEYGNLEATVRGAPRPLRLWAKLAPEALYAKHDGLRRVGQTLLFVDERGVRSMWVARPRE